MLRAAALVTVTNRLERTDVPRLLEAAGKAIGQLAAPETVIRVGEKNPDAIWLFARRGRSRPEGFMSALLLNEKGRSALSWKSGLDLLGALCSDPQDAGLSPARASRGDLCGPVTHRSPCGGRSIV